MKKQFFAIIVALISTTINAQSWWNSKKIKGNGNVITKSRTIKSFEKVSIGGSFDVNLIDGTEGSVTIKGEENIIPYIETIVEKGNLKVKFKENTNIKTTRPLVVTIPFKTIHKVALGGSGNVHVKKELNSESISFSLGGSGNIISKVNTNSVKAAIGGSGSINLSGKTDDLKCSIAGSGNIKAYDLKTNNLKASIAGSGNIKTTVNSKIKASVAGSGSIYYKGNPKNINTNSIGSGDVIDKN